MLFLSERLPKKKCFGTIFEKLFHFEVPEEVKTGEKCYELERLRNKVMFKNMPTGQVWPIFWYKTVNSSWTKTDIKNR